MKNIFIYLAMIVCLLSSCSTEDYNYNDVISLNSTELKERDSTLTRSSYNKYSFQFDVYPIGGDIDHYHSFLVVKASGIALFDHDPFFFTYDDGDIVYAADHSQYYLFNETDKIFFGDDGFLSSYPYDYDFDNGIGKHDVIKVGDRVAIFASKERYTNEDLRTHDGDSDYFSKVSESFECYYFTTVQNHTIIIYGRYGEGWCG